MTHLDIMLPIRKRDLVSWRTAETGRYFLRNHRTAESFQLGEQEHFLLSRLDGLRTPAEICADFAKQFGLPLSLDELDEYVQLADAQGLLQDPDSGEVVSGPLERAGTAPADVSARPGYLRRGAVRSLKAASTALRWSTWLPNTALSRMQQHLRRLEFTPRADDVFIVTYPRSGTTWMQMILYQLTTDGRMDLPHIAEFCPWFEKSVRSAHGFNLRPAPRLFKSHLHYRQIPKGAGKYIYVARNGKDVAVSYYHLYRRYNGYEGTFDEFFERFVKGRVGFGSWFKHVRGWWKRRNDPNVLFLRYEDVKSNFDNTVQKIADFCGWDPSPETLQRVRLRSSFEFMKQHESRFDPALETLWEQGVQLESFLRNGRIGEGTTTLTREQLARFEKTYSRRLGELEVTLK